MTSKVMEPDTKKSASEKFKETLKKEADQASVIGKTTVIVDRNLKVPPSLVSAKRKWDDEEDVDDMPETPAEDTEPWMMRPTPTPEEQQKKSLTSMNHDWENIDPRELPTSDSDERLSVLEEERKKPEKPESRKVRRIRSIIDGVPMCLTEAPNGYLKAMECEADNKRQKWYFYQGGLKNTASLHMCLSYDKVGRRQGFLHMKWACAKGDGKMRWTMDGKSGRLKSENNKQCISMHKADHFYVKLLPCPGTPSDTN
mmetsp:Transcript_108988/g.189169  ORF Transcript_108988/g.189169 Transcript_108988/m.189169 type:complete len:256 (+) Transcript_108988:1-768(+)